MSELFERLIKTYVKRCRYFSNLTDNHLNPLLGIEDDQMLRAGVLRLMREGEAVEAKVLLRLISGEIEMKTLFRELEQGLKEEITEEAMEEWLNRESKIGEKVEVPF